MNQHDQMRKALRSFIEAMDGSCDHPDTSSEREALRHAKRKAKQALAAEPAPLVMVTDLEMLDMYCEPNSDKEMFEFGRAVQKRFMEKNGLKDEPN